MRKIFFIFCLLTTENVHLYCQNVSSVLGYSGIDYNYNKITIRNIPLFNAGEIKERGIKKCYIIHPWFSWTNNTPQTDTISIFNFYADGNIQREIRYRSWDKSMQDTIEPGSYEKRFKKIDSTVSVQNSQTEITKYYIWAFNWESDVEDTGYIKKEIYDNKNRLIEYKHNGTPDYHQINFCGTGITLHDKYRYDENNNIIYYQDLYFREYASFKYRQNSRVVRVYDSLTKKQLRKYTVHIKVNDETILEKEGFITTLKRFDKNSKLFSLISNRQSGRGFSSKDYIFVYEYFDRQEPQQGKEKLFVAK
jgi:hypothetical protein